MQSLSISLVILTVSFAQIRLSAQHLDVEGDVKIRGNIDINHPEDTTSVFIGRNAGLNMDFSSTGSNTFMGSNAGAFNTTGFSNSFFGQAAGLANTTGLHNSFFGMSSGKDNVSGSSNSFFGIAAGHDNVSGKSNSFFGSLAGFSNISGESNSFFGAKAGRLSTGDNNAFFGYEAGSANTTGSSNSFFGLRAGEDNLTGYLNSFFGVGAGLNNTVGFRNSFFGSNAGNIINQGDDNTFIGYLAGYNIETGTGNVMLGALAGGTQDAQNRIAIGYNIASECDYCAVIGGTGSEAIKLGLGTNTPTRYLTLVGSSDVTKPDFAITSQVAVIELGSGQNGPHGFAFGDSGSGEGIKLFYRTTPNELRVERGNDLMDDTRLFAVAMDGIIYADSLRDIGDKKNMQYNSTTGEIGYDNSSRRYKIKIQSLADDWTKILQVRPVQYTRPRSPEHWEYGYIAEEMDSLGLSNLVGYDAEGLPDDVKYDRMVLYLTEIIKMHEDQLGAIHLKNMRLTRRLSRLEGQQLNKSKSKKR